MESERGLVHGLLEAYVARTRLEDGADGTPVRYLWTDAFAVCTCLGLHERGDGPEWLERARRLASQVHRVLGRHRPDDRRTGWISGLADADGARHPTVGGLRIGKPLPERGPEERFDRTLEWERDGQYYHYLTRWIHALTRLAGVAGDATAARHAAELATAAHRGFAYRTPGGPLRLYWKMSIDLQRPLVPSMGQHDPLDGLVAYCGADAARRQMPEGREEAASPRLDREIRELAAICEGRSWATDDPLGLGGLLVDAWMLARLLASGHAPDGAGTGTLRGILEAAVAESARSLEIVASTPFERFPADRRLPFRELGLSLGLAAAPVLRRAVLAAGASEGRVGAALDVVEEGAALRARIHDFWTVPAHRSSPLWLEHRDINDVMLAASLDPGGCLALESPTVRHGAAHE